MNYAHVLAGGKSGSGCQKIRPLDKKQLEQPDEFINKKYLKNKKTEIKDSSGEENLKSLMSKLKIKEDGEKYENDNRLVKIN